MLLIIGENSNEKNWNAKFYHKIRCKGQESNALYSKDVHQLSPHAEADNLKFESGKCMHGNKSTENDYLLHTL